MKTIDIIRQIEDLATKLEERGLYFINWNDWDDTISAHLALEGTNDKEDK
jgi:hypothetical protein